MKRALKPRVVELTGTIDIIHEAQRLRSSGIFGDVEREEVNNAIDSVTSFLISRIQLRHVEIPVELMPYYMKLVNSVADNT